MMFSGTFPLRKPGIDASRMNTFSTFWYGALVSSASAFTERAITQGLDSFVSNFIANSCLSLENGWAIITKTRGYC